MLTMALLLPGGHLTGLGGGASGAGGSVEGVLIALTVPDGSRSRGLVNECPDTRLT